MSLQLIIYPQYYTGQFNAVSTNPNQFVVNGINFSGLNSTTTYSSGSINVPSDTLTNQPPTVLNTWYRFRSTLGGTPALPVVTAGQLILNSVVVPFACLSGVYQRMSGLTVGQSYTIKVKLSITGTGDLFLGVYNGTSVVSNTSFPVTSTVITDTFIATATDNTLMISYFNSVAANIAIDKISVLPTGAAAGSIELTDGQVICDLYEEEDMPLTLSVDDFKNAAERVQSYSKAFNLPGTKRNNKIFDNIFEITRSGDGLSFNPYLKTQCVLKQDGFILFEGYLRLIDIQDKMGEISYNVNLYSEVIALADVLSEKTFSMLDFGELSHAYHKTNIKNSWNDSPNTGINYANPSTSGFRNDNDTLKYPFCDWNHQILIANGATGSAATIGNPELTRLDQAFRPFIQLKYLIDRIFQDSPFRYTSTFFNTTDFKKLYMDFNWGEDRNGEESVGCGDSRTSATFYLNINTQECGGNGLSASTVGWDFSTDTLTATQDGTAFKVVFLFYFNATSGADTGHWRWEHYDASTGNYNYYAVATSAFPNNSSNPYAGSFNLLMDQNDTLKPQFKTDTAGRLDQNNSGYFILTENPETITSNILLQSLRGELGQWEFLKGIFTMFNLVSMPDAEDKNNILIEPYNETFVNNPDAKTHDWTDKVDISEIKLTPLTELKKKTVFKFVEDEDDYAFMNYKMSVQGHLYGSKVYDASGFTILSGEEEIVAEPFAATVVKPLMTQFSNLITPSLYAYNADEGTTEGIENSPRIMYNNGVKDSGTTYYIPAFNGQSSENQSDFLQFSHLSEIPTTTSALDFHFGECQLIQPIGNAVTNNLFNTYWLPYYNELYNPNTRTMTIKVYLKPGDITNFRFYDKVMIKNREYRVNRIDYKPNDLATVEFILIP